MDIKGFLASDAGLDERIEELVATRLSGVWTDEDQALLDRLVALRGSHMIRHRKPFIRRMVGVHF